MMYLAEIYVKKKSNLFCYVLFQKKNKLKSLFFTRFTMDYHSNKNYHYRRPKNKISIATKKVANNIPFSKTNMALARNYLLIEKQMSEFSINLLSTELSKKISRFYI